MLEYRFGDRNISEGLEMSVEEAPGFFRGRRGEDPGRSEAPRAAR